MAQLRRTSYEEVAECADVIESVYTVNGVNIPNDSHLFSCLMSARELKEAWDRKDNRLENNKKLLEKMINEASECSHLGGVLAWLRQKPNMVGHLKQLLVGSINVQPGHR